MFMRVRLVPVLQFESTQFITGSESMTDMPDVEKVSAVEGFKSESD